jgi:hypothetical protein
MIGRSSRTAAQASRQVVVMIGCALPGIQRQEGDAVSIGHPAAEWKQPAATVHRLKQSEHPAPEHPQRVPAPGQQHRSHHAGDHRHPQLVLTDGSGNDLLHLLLGHAHRMPPVAPPVGSSRHPCSQMAAVPVDSPSTINRWIREGATRSHPAPWQLPGIPGARPDTGAPAGTCRHVPACRLRTVASIGCRADAVQRVDQQQAPH